MDDGPTNARHSGMLHVPGVDVLDVWGVMDLEIASLL